MAFDRIIINHLDGRDPIQGRPFTFDPEVQVPFGRLSIEIGSVMFAYPDPESGEINYPTLELVRLAIPRRVYTQSHLDYVVDTLVKINEKRNLLRGYKLTYAPELLRHFTARFEPI